MTTLSHIDRLLTDALHAASTDRSPLARIVSDLEPAERDTLADFIEQARMRLVDAARLLELAPQAARIPVTRAVETALGFAVIAIEEVNVTRLRGYGALSDNAAQLIERVEGDLTRSLNHIRTYLLRGTRHDLGGRLTRLERAIAVPARFVLDPHAGNRDVGPRDPKLPVDGLEVFSGRAETTRRRCPQREPVAALRIGHRSAQRRTTRRGRAADTSRVVRPRPLPLRTARLALDYPLRARKK
jgi:hypothetical protein